MYEELKKAAEACKDLLPLRYMERPGALYIRNDCGIVFTVLQDRSFPEFTAHNKAYADLALAANPSAVLALIAEVERLKKSSDHWKTMHDAALDSAKTEAATADNLKAENARSTEREILQLAEIEMLRMRIKELDLLFGRYILAMRAAVIEEEHGLGAEGAMMWIYNSLVGPGQLPPENETLAQAYFDREIVAVDDGMQEVLAFHDARRKAKESAK